jgi:hypothetical protein
MGKAIDSGSAIFGPRQMAAVLCAFGVLLRLAVGLSSYSGARGCLMEV